MRAALLQAMARDPNGRFETAQQFAQAIRSSLATIGGPASPNDLARLLFNDFGDEMSSRDEILKAADEPAPAPAPRPPTGGMPVVRATPPPLPPAARSGELAGAAPRPKQPTSQMGVPTMIVAQKDQTGRNELLTPATPMDTPI